MEIISRLEQATSLNGLVAAGQRAARLIRPGKFRNALHGTWLGHPLHPLLVQAAAGTWLSASILDLSGIDDRAARGLTAAGLAASVPAIAAGAADWSEQHEQQMRVGVIHALANGIAVACYGSSLLTQSQRVGRALRLGSRRSPRAALSAVICRSGWPAGRTIRRTSRISSSRDGIPSLP